MEKILIVEDEQDIANAFKKQLTLLGGYNVDLANGGDVALAKMKSLQYSLILLDLSMMHVDGVTVLQILHTDNEKKIPEYKHAPIIVITNVTSNEIRLEVKKYDVVDFIVKSDIRSDELLKRIKVALT